MRTKYSTIFAALAATLLALLWGCDTPVEEQGPIELILDKTELSVPAEGGTLTVGYTLLNAPEGGKLTITPEYDWVVGCDTSVAGKLSFEIAPNKEGNSRTSLVDIAYPGLYPNGQLTITQEVGEPDAISITCRNVQSTYITLDIVPQDKSLAYVFILGNGNYLESGDLMENDEALWESDMETFQNFADGFGIPLSAAVSVFMYEGEKINYTIRDIIPDTKYVAYAYGFDLEAMKPTTDIYRTVIHSKPVEEYVLNFDLEAEVTGYHVELDITPIDYDGYFFFGVFEAKDCPASTSDAVMKELCYSAWEQEKEYYNSFIGSVEEGLHFYFNELAYKRTAHLGVDLAANTEYVLWACGMNDEALINTIPERLYFTTGAAAPSDNQITLSVSEIKSRKATLTIETTNSDSYVAMLVQEGRFEGKSDSEVMEYICTNFKLNYNSGTMSEVATGLTPATNYEFLAFGCESGCPTTSLKRLTFTTAENVYADLAFEIRIDKFYDSAEVGALNSDWADIGEGYAIVPADVIVDDAAVNYYYAAISTADAGRYTDEILTQTLYDQGPSDDSTVSLIPYDVAVMFIGVAEDAEGNFTELWKSKELTFRYANRSSASDFFGASAAFGVGAVGESAYAPTPLLSNITPATDLLAPSATGRMLSVEQ